MISSVDCDGFDCPSPGGRPSAQKTGFVLGEILWGRGNKASSPTVFLYCEQNKYKYFACKKKRWEKDRGGEGKTAGRELRSKGPGAGAGMTAWRELRSK